MQSKIPTVPDRTHTSSKLSKQELRVKHEEMTKSISATVSASYMSRYGNRYKTK